MNQQDSNIFKLPKIISSLSKDLSLASPQSKLSSDVLKINNGKRKVSSKFITVP